MKTITISDFIEIIEPGDFLLVKRTDSFVSWLIQLFCEYSHVGMISETLMLRHYIWPYATEHDILDVTAGGVVMLRRFKDLTPKQTRAMMHISQKDVREKRPYDVKAYGGYAPVTGLKKLFRVDLSRFNNPYNNEGYVCSSGANYWAVYAKRYIDRTKGIEMITPDDIRTTEEMGTIFKGRITC